MQDESYLTSRQSGRSNWGALFLEHPHSLGEGYWQHQRHALHFGATLITAGLACVVHALVPGLFLRTGSAAVARLHHEMTALRRLNPTYRNPPERCGSQPVAGYAKAHRA
jgi:hypothetical protein